MKISRKFVQHEIFELGIALKGLNALVETIGGILLLFSSTTAMNSVVHTVARHALAGGVGHFLARHLMSNTQNISAASKTFAAVYLITHGAIKIGIVIALWLNKLWAYPVALFVFTGFVVYQVARYQHTHASWLLWLALFDAFVIYLTWHEYHEQKTTRGGSQPVIGQESHIQA